MGNSLINKMRDKLIEALDPTLVYSHDDFMNEFNKQPSVGELNSDIKFTFNFINKSNNKNPDYETIGSSGFDIRANLDEKLILKSGEFKAIPTGLYFEIPNNFEIQVRPRSGLAFKYGVTVLNTPGTIDADYRGEVKIILINHGENDFTINHGDRVAQCVISTVTAKQLINLTEVDKINENTERGSSGFGSTGIK